MKVAIKDLKPNPFRDIDNYPIDQEKVENLKNSISETGFWDNILARKKNGVIQIAYGHHRLEALKQVCDQKDIIDIPIKELDDSTMIRIMANENMESWGMSTRVLKETIKAIREYLQEHPEIYVNLMDDCDLKTGYLKKIRSESFQKDLLKMAGSKTIAKFLGGSWTHHMIDPAITLLDAEKEKEVSKEIIEEFEKPTHAVRFVRAIKTIKKVTPEQQKEAVKTIQERQDYSKVGMESAILDEKYKGKKTIKIKEERNLIEFKTFAKKCIVDFKLVKDDFIQLTTLKKEHNFDFSRYGDCEELKIFQIELGIMIHCYNEFMKIVKEEEGEQENVTEKTHLLQENV